MIKLSLGNCGRLPEDWTIENLMRKYAPTPFNPNIAHTFCLAGFIERWGRGMEKICNACSEGGVPRPACSIHPGDIMMEFLAPENRVIRVTDKVTVTLSDGERLILGLLSEDPGHTMPKLAD